MLRLNDSLRKSITSLSEAPFSASFAASITGYPIAIAVSYTHLDVYKRQTLLSYASNALDPFGRFLGVDGFIILAFILSLPANEITLPILVMGYLATGSMTEISDMETLKNILTANGWTIVTAINMMLLTLYHSPCITTVSYTHLDVYKRQTSGILSLEIIIAPKTDCSASSLKGMLLSSETEFSESPLSE